MVLPIAGLAIAQGALQAGTGIMGAIAGNRQANAEARARNEAMMKQYKYQLQIRDKKYKDAQQIFGTKLGQYDLTMKAADRAASRAYGVEQLKQSQRLKSAAFASQKLDRALAKSGGTAAASGRSGKSFSRLDRFTEGDFVRNQAMIAENLLAGEVSSEYRQMGIRDQLESARNQAYSQVAVAPEAVPMMPLAPTQVSGPSNAGMMIGIGNSLLKGFGTAMGGIAPNPGNMFGGGGTPVPTFGQGSFPSPTPITSGLNFFG